MLLPAPAQGAITIVCRDNDTYLAGICHLLNDRSTELCTKIERDFLRALMGGCSTPISALAEIKNNEVHFTGNILSPEGKMVAGINASDLVARSHDMGINAANQLLSTGGKVIADSIRNATK